MERVRWCQTFGLMLGALKKLKNEENEMGFVSCLWKTRLGDFAASVRSLAIFLPSGYTVLFLFVTLRLERA